MPIKVLLVDSHTITRLGISQTLAACSDIEVIGEVETLSDGIEIARQQRPDVAVIDIDTNASETLSTLSQLHADIPGLRTLVFTATDSAEVAEQVVSCGAAGYLIKAASPDELALAIRSVHSGRLFISHSRSALAPKVAVQSARLNNMTSKDSLSVREREVLVRLADGMTNKQVAAELFLSIKTVETYRARIMKKFGLVDRVGLVQFARQVIEPQIAV